MVIDGLRRLKSNGYSVNNVVRGQTVSEQNMTETEAILIRLSDRLFGWELVEYMGITAEEIIEAFRERTVDILDELEEEFLD